MFFCSGFLLLPACNGAGLGFPCFVRYCLPTGSFCTGVSTPHPSLPAQLARELEEPEGARERELHTALGGCMGELGEIVKIGVAAAANQRAPRAGLRTTPPRDRDSGLHMMVVYISLCMKCGRVHVQY